MRKFAIVLFFGFLALIIGPDFMPGMPVDDIIYAIIDILLAHYILKKKKPTEKDEMDTAENVKFEDPT